MKIYFAHPCFNEDQKAFKERFLSLLKTALSQTEHGSDITIIDPFDYAPVIENDLSAKAEMAEYIKIECIRLLEESYLVIALVDDNDTGVAFEAGYAHAVNKPVILISSDNCLKANAMLLGSAKAVVNDILDEEQIKRLSSLILFFYGTFKASRKKPEYN